MRARVLFLLFIPFLSYGQSLESSVVYYSAGSFFDATAQLARLSGGLCYLLPQQMISPNECLLLSDVCSRAARIAYRGDFDRGQWQQTWLKNREFLLQVPVSSQEDRNLLHFLQERWLAKIAGISRISLEWVYPCFGITVQANPMSNHAYARLPSTNMTEVYKQRMDHWKREFSHDLPMILTRAADIAPFLPHYFSMLNEEIGEEFAKKIGSKAVVDFTSFLSANGQVGSDWERRFSDCCAAQQIDVNEMICIQRLQGEGIGGIRILPLPGQDRDAVSKQYDILFNWISTLGLAASRIELDRGVASEEWGKHCSVNPQTPNREEFLSVLESFEASCSQVPEPQKILIEGTFQVLKGFLASLTEQKWEEVLTSPTKASIAWMSMAKIQKQLQLLSEHASAPLFPIALQLEQVHADLAALLEVANPFTVDDFGEIYRDQIILPDSLKAIASYGIHSSGMACTAAIVKAVEKEAGSVHAIYGENSYYECVSALEKLANSSVRANEATGEDWQRANLLIVQWNPAIQTDLRHEQYRVENIESMIRICLKDRCEAPLTLALDGTLDLIDSPKTTQLLTEFSQEILEGKLTVVVFRSGNKFDLLGMDNYCGAPFFILRKKNPSFDLLFTTPALQCDRLSLNWFCLAYRYARPQLESYKKQIFSNTRALLNKIPKILQRPNSRYRVAPMAAEGAPSFIDLKVSGPLHKIKSAAIILPFLFLESMQKNQPIFIRPSLGFYHPNLTLIFGEECSTIRLTLGLDPAQIEVFEASFEKISSLL